MVYFQFEENALEKKVWEPETPLKKMYNILSMLQYIKLVI